MKGHRLMKVHCTCNFTLDFCICLPHEKKQSKEEKKIKNLERVTRQIPSNEKYIFILIPTRELAKRRKCHCNKINIKTKINSLRIKKNITCRIDNLKKISSLNKKSLKI